MCLSVCLGSSSFAIEFTAGEGLGGENGVVVEYNYSEQNTDLTNAIDKLKGNLETFFGYAAGTMTFVQSKTSVSFYDGNGFKLAYGISENDSYKSDQAEGPNNQKYKFTLQSINLGISDYKRIKDEFGGDVKNYLVNGLGISEAALKVNKTEDGCLMKYELDENGNKISDGKGGYKYSATGKGDTVMDDPAWLKDASNWIQGGVNFSMTINLGGSEATITLSENAKQKSTLGSFNGKSYVSSSSQYNEGGFLLSTTNVELAVSSSTDSGTTKYEKQYSVTVMNSKGQQDYTYKTNANGEAIEYTKKEMKTTTDDNGNMSIDYIETDKKASGHTIDFSYTSNGTLKSYTDNTTGNTTHYAAGQVSYVTNEKNAIVSRYNYENGILKTVQSFNNGNVVNTTIFDAFGRQLGSVYGDVKYNTAVSAIQSVRNTGIVSDNCIVQSYSVYNDMIGSMSSAAKEKHGISGNTTTTYGYLQAIKSVNVTPGTTEDTTATLNGKHYFIKGSDGKWKSVTEAEYNEQKNKDKNSVREIDIRTEGGIAFVNKEDAKFLSALIGVSDDTDKEDEGNWIRMDKVKSDGKYIFAGKEKSDQYYAFNFGSGDGTKGAKKAWSGASSVRAEATKIFAALGITVPDNFDVDSFKQTETGKTLSGMHLLGNEYSVTKHDSATLTVTTMSQGVSIKQKTVDAVGDCSTETLKGMQYAHDPAVVGKVDRIETVNGKQYVVLKDAKVDLEDGEGFKSADGEEIYVDISSLSDEEKSGLKEGSAFAAAGYIDTSVEGHLAINNLYARKIGGSDVDNMVQSFSAKLAGDAEYKANVQLNMLTFAKAAADGKTFKDVKGGWKLLSEYGGGAPAIF